MHTALFLGTRPEAIKLAPLAVALRQTQPAWRTSVVDTGQHRELSAGMLGLFGVDVDATLDALVPGQSLSELVARVHAGADRWIEAEKPDLVVVQGDTSSVVAVALAAFHRRVPVAHVEAGLRSGSLAEPFPEEANRRLTSVLTTLHFAPTERAKKALLAEGVPPERVHVTGNTVIDALRLERKRQTAPKAGADVRTELDRLLGAGWNAGPLVLVTGHRRESFGPGLERVCGALRDLAERHPDVRVVYAVHLNPAVQEPVHRLLAGVKNVSLIPPQSYAPFVALLDACRLVITDSGGVQEEGPAFGKPVLVTRDRTERPEGVEVRCAELVGTDRARIATRASQLLTDWNEYSQMARVTNPYGDGHACKRIVEHLAAWSAERAG